MQAVRWLLPVLVVLLVLRTPHLVQAQAAPIQTVVATFKQAITAADGATVAGLFADDVVVSDLGTTATGKTEAIAELQQAFAQNPNFSIAFSDTSYVVDTAVERFAFASDPLRAAGVSRIWAIETIVVQQGKIVSYTAVFDTSDAETARFLQVATPR